MLKFENKEIFLACGHTDMRKSINGLSNIVQVTFNLNPLSEVVFVFCNRAKDRLKILEWDGDGFWLHLKRLERGRFRWPDSSEELTMSLSKEELMYLLGSPGLFQKLKGKKPFEQIAV